MANGLIRQHKPTMQQRNDCPSHHDIGSIGCDTMVSARDHLASHSSSALPVMTAIGEHCGSSSCGASRNGTHRAPAQSIARIDEAVALPSPAVVLSARLNRYYGQLRRPPGWLALPGSSPVTGHHTPTALPSRLGRGRPLQFPPPLSERSEPLTPGSSSRLCFQDLHRFHGLRPSPPGSALPRPTRHRASVLTTRQASLDVTDRSVAHPVRRGVRRRASAPPVSRRHRRPATGPPDGYPDRTHTGKRQQAYESVTDHLHDQPPTFPTGHTGED